MSTLSIPAPSRPKLLSLALNALSRTAAFVVTMLDAIDEARRMAHEAQMRHPFVR